MKTTAQVAHPGHSSFACFTSTAVTSNTRQVYCKGKEEYRDYRDDDYGDADLAAMSVTRPESVRFILVSAVSHRVRKHRATPFVSVDSLRLLRIFRQAETIPLRQVRASVGDRQHR